MQRKKVIITAVLLCVLVMMSGCYVLQKDTPQQEEPAEAAASTMTETEGAVPETENDKKADMLSAPYDTLLQEQFQNFGGKCSYVLHIYGRGEAFSAENEQMKAASVIKLFIMEHVYHLIEKGELTPDSLIGGRRVSNLIEQMITVSDNTATNIIIEHFTIETIDAYIKASGYTGTVLARKMLDKAAASRGEENYTTARDVAMFLDKLYENKESYPQSEMLAVMKRQKVATKLRRDMPAGVEMASKTGELSDTENDACIVFTPKGDYAIVCLTGGGSPQVAKNAMAIACRKVYDTLQSE